MSSNRLLRVDFFYDIVSPYSLFGLEILYRYERLWNLQINLCPIFLGGIMVGSKNSPPGLNKSKSVYMDKDLKRISSQANIPFKYPSDFFSISQTSLNPMRLLTAIKAKAPKYQKSVALAFWKRVWLNDQQIKDVQCLNEAMIDGGISDENERKSLIEFSNSSEIKSELRQLTDRLVEYGAFGAPVFLYYTGKESDTSMEWKEKESGPTQIVEFFFGSDRFEQAANLLGKKYLGMNPQAAKL